MPPPPSWTAVVGALPVAAGVLPPQPLAKLENYNLNDKNQGTNKCVVVDPCLGVVIVVATTRVRGCGGGGLGLMLGDAWKLQQRNKKLHFFVGKSFAFFHRSAASASLAASAAGGRARGG